MNPNHIPAFGEEYSQMVAVQKMERCDIAKVIKAQMAVAACFNGSGPWAGIERIEDVTLVLVSGLKPAHREVVRLVQVPLYFAEVCNYVALPQEALDQRLQFALETGYVPYGRDEAVAVMIAGDNNYVFTHVYEVNPEGEARSKAGFFDHTEKRWSQLRHIKNLNRTETERELGEVRGDLLWWSGKRGFGDVQEQRQRLTLMLLEKHLEVAQPERTSSGAIIKRSFIENGSVESTAHLRQPSKGWRSYVTVTGSQSQPLAETSEPARTKRPPTPCAKK